jgi:hypothetical protein
MGKNSLVKTLGTIMGALVFALGWVLNFTRNPNFSPQVIIAIGFILVVGFLCWTIYGLHNAVNSLKESRPSIYVQPKRERQWCLLEVINWGAEGTFRCQIQLASNDDKLKNIPLYDGVWRDSGIEKKLLKGQSGFLELADIQDSGHGLYLRFYQYYEHETSISSSTNGIMPITQADGIKYLPQKFEYHLVVKISSSPELRDEVFGHVYVLNVEGFVVNPTMDLMPELTLVSRKGDSQN